MAKKSTSKKDKHHHRGVAATIVFADNVFWDSSDPSSCPFVATTIPHNCVVKRNQKMVRWDIDGSAVANFDPGLVDLKFKDINPTKNKQLGSVNNRFILVDIKDKTKIAAGRYVYHVMYDGNEAQDPELDVSGDVR